MTSREPDLGTIVSNILARRAGEDGALLPILHDVQADFGWVPDEVVPLVAAALNISRADVHGVLTFYHDFRRAPPARRTLKLCRAEACQARGAHITQAAIELALNVEMDVPHSSGEIALEAVYCLGLCASGPAALYEGRPVARLSGRRLETFLGQIA